MPQYQVRCKPSSTSPIKTTIWQGGSEITNPIRIRASTVFEFITDNLNSDTSVHGFTLEADFVGPKDVEDVSGQGTTKIRFTDKCRQRGDIIVNMRAVAAASGPHPTGGKPIIRNEPRGAFFTFTVIGLVLLAIALVAFAVYTHLHG